MVAPLQSPGARITSSHRVLAVLPSWQSEQDRIDHLLTPRAESRCCVEKYRHSTCVFTSTKWFLLN